MVVVPQKAEEQREERRPLNINCQESHIMRTKKSDYRPVPAEIRRGYS